MKITSKKEVHIVLSQDEAEELLEEIMSIIKSDTGVLAELVQDIKMTLD